MADTAIWSGISRRNYTYTVHDINWVPNADQDGNYIFARQINGIWYAVYVGQGDLRERYHAALREGCVTRKGATHYHEHLNSSGPSRRLEETDVIDGNPECKGPRGCNGQG